MSYFTVDRVTMYGIGRKALQMFPLPCIVQEGEERIIGRKQFHSGFWLDLQFQQENSKNFQGGFLNKIPEMFLHRHSRMAIYKLFARLGAAKHLTTETAQHARRENELTRHLQFRVSQHPTMPCLPALLLDKVNRHCAPITNDIIEEKPWNL